MPEGLESKIEVRKVTQAHAAWTEAEPGSNGVFTLQLIMDGGAEEYVLQPSSDDVDILLELFDEANGVIFDKSRKVLIFNDLMD